MGTNYYAIPKLEDIQKQAIIKAIEDNDFLKVKRLNPKEIHIGKSSMGWEFLFNHNDWKYFHDLESLNLFLSSCKIYDEYDEEIPLDEFWSMVNIKMGKTKSLGQSGFVNFGLNFASTTEFS